MNSLILDWSEVWATLIPILVWIWRKPVDDCLIPVKSYLLVMFLLNLVIDLTYFRLYSDNNVLYNIVSIARLLLFMGFFAKLHIPATAQKRFAILMITIILILLNFWFVDPIMHFSSAMFTLEGIVLLILSILYFLIRMKSDDITTVFDTSLYIITGLAIYEAVCFPIFLFYDALTKTTTDYAVSIWDLHNLVYIVFCLFIARAFYGNSNHQYR